MQLRGKVAVVTGSTSGIGLGIARSLARQGAAVLLNGFGDAGEIERLRAELSEAAGVPAAYAAADIAHADQAAQLIEAAVRRLGGLDILVNNAGVQHTDAIEAFPLAQWDRVLGINLSGVFYTMRAAIPPMRARGWGRILNIASAHGLVASARKSAYVAAKHGVVGLTKVAALELAHTGVTANAICPGWVLTPLVQQQIDARAAASGGSVEDESHALLAEKQPMRRFTTPEQIGAFCVFLCSDAASTITGTALPIDGGWTAH
jgi:3-hydroxybutyrate dehydrogenase